MTFSAPPACGPVSTLRSSCSVTGLTRPEISRSSSARLPSAVALRSPRIRASSRPLRAPREPGQPAGPPDDAARPERVVPDVLELAADVGGVQGGLDRQGG